MERFLRSRGFSHSLLVQLKRFPDGLLLNNIPVFTNRCLTAGSYLQVNLHESDRISQVIPTELPLTVLYEDDDLFVVSKPAGMPVHPSHNNRNNTLANALAFIYQRRNEPFVFRAIGRLDKNTSGLVLLAKNALSGCLLSDMLKKRTIRREYLAVCKGLLPRSGTIGVPIGRVPGSALLRKVRTDGDHAVTHFERLDYKNGFSLARIWLDTGRTHQIRVHLAYIGHPLPGDFLYCPDFSQICRHALHSARLWFPHPLTEKLMHFTVPLPPDMAKLLGDTDNHLDSYTAPQQMDNQ